MGILHLRFLDWILLVLLLTLWDIGTIIEVNVSELGLVTQTGKVVWGKPGRLSSFRWNILDVYCWEHTVDLVYFCSIFVRAAAKYAQVTNNPELDGCINAVLLV